MEESNSKKIKWAIAIILVFIVLVSGWLVFKWGKENFSGAATKRALSKDSAVIVQEQDATAIDDSGISEDSESMENTDNTQQTPQKIGTVVVKSGSMGQISITG